MFGLSSRNYSTGVKRKRHSCHNNSGPEYCPEEIACKHGADSQV